MQQAQLRFYFKEIGTMKKTLWMALLLMTTSFTWAEMPEDVKSLKGLEAVAMSVYVSNLEQAKRYGLREYEIAKTMEKILRENGIHPMTAEEQEKAPDSPVLNIKVTPMIDEKYNACSIGIVVELKQSVKLVSDESIVVKNVATWQHNAISLINVKLLLPGVSERIDTYLKDFIDDWCEANGKPLRFKESNGKKDETEV